MKPEKVIIMRSPVLMEDEGRHFFVKRLPRHEAEEWIKNQKGQYFGPGDYYILESKQNNVGRSLAKEPSDAKATRYHAMQAIRREETCEMGTTLHRSAEAGR